MVQGFLPPCVPPQARGGSMVQSFYPPVSPRKRGEGVMSFPPSHLLVFPLPRLSPNLSPVAPLGL